jgi:hypothetical protein
MLKMTLFSLALFALIGCGTAPRPTRSETPLYSVISEKTDPQTRSLTLSIKVSGPSTQTNVRSVAESAIDARRDQFQNIIVNSYTEEMRADDPPFAISRFEGYSVTHRFNSLAETQKIPTH